MRRLATQAEVSFHDMQRIAGLDISMRAIREEVITVIEQARKTEAVPCPNCEIENKVTLGTNPGATKHTKCAGCKQPFSVHRLPDGVVKINFKDTHHIRCPHCNNAMRVQVQDTEVGIIIRNCFECYSRIRLDAESGEILDHEIRKPHKISSETIKDGKAQCPHCLKVVIIKGGCNSRGEKLQYCPHCTDLILIEDKPLSDSTRPAHGSN
jgi:DNA-directed RNA polymerase subunit RPC12/RpoP